jgi:peptidoglycan-N-acetylglucosamine deacetylase
MPPARVSSSQLPDDVHTAGNRRNTRRDPAIQRDRLKAWLKRQARVVGSITSVATHEPHVVLTFDDGPDPEVTPQLLEVLARRGATATFFVLLDPARRHPNLVERIRAEGHEVALHGLDHRRLPRLHRREAVSWLRSSRDELQRLVGTPVPYFRPPHGAQSPYTRILTRALGMQVVLWNATTWDWKNISQEERVAKVLECAQPGTILLAHDGAHHDSTAGATASGVDKVDLLERVLEAYDQRGLRCVSLTDALAAGARPVRTASFSR